MTQTILVANRGEIAIRIFRTAKRLGMRTVAVYSDADAAALHVRSADLGVRLGPAPAGESYLDRARIIDAAAQSGATLVHPGYGFLAEDDAFAADCEAAGLIFVGPPSEVLRRVGDKAAARELATQAGVALLPGYAGEDQSDEAFAKAADDIGYPVLVKPSAGGGGKGMQVVTDADELARAIASAKRVSKAAFGDDRLILERYITGPRHVEVQILADAHGNVVHLGERDCSMQRRHQKVMEESPAPHLDDASRARIHAAGVTFATAASYRNAGTCEFVVGNDGTFGFIEMNARLQVEHPVTEAVTGLDLVELQLRIALGEALPSTTQTPDGHAIEVRVYAEDPDAGFLPQSGRIEHVRWPDGVRVDPGVGEGSDVSTYYDPMLAKIIASGTDRADALRILRQAVTATEVLGVRTNLAFLAAVLADATVDEGRVTTDWLERVHGDWSSAPDDGTAICVAAAAEAAHLLQHHRKDPGKDPWTSLGAWRAGGEPKTTVVLRGPDDERALVVRGSGPFTVDGRTVSRETQHHAWSVDDRHVAAARGDGVWFVHNEGTAYGFAVGPAQRRLGAAASHLDAPLPGQVLAVHVLSGDRVAKGDELIVVEAMKMEHSVRAPADGVVRTVLCAPGDQVVRGQTLVDFATDVT